MGEVYRATDARLKRDVAVKVLPAACSADPTRRELFKEISPADRAVVLNLTNVTLPADEPSHAYSYFRHLSHLFVVDGAR